jgi:hypothetical protein
MRTQEVECQPKQRCVTGVTGVTGSFGAASGRLTNLAFVRCQRLGPVHGRHFYRAAAGSEMFPHDAESRATELLVPVRNLVTLAASQEALYLLHHSPFSH